MNCTKLKQIEIAFVGSSGVGKSSLIKRYMQDKFSQDIKATKGIRLYQTQIQVGRQIYRCNLFDTEGFDNNNGIVMLPLLKNIGGFIIVYDISNEGSFVNSQQCFNEISEYCRPQNQNIAMIGNKNDLHRQVVYDQVNQYCLSKDIYYVETNAKNDRLILNIIERVMKNLIISRKFKQLTIFDRVQKKFKLSCERLKRSRQQGCLRSLQNKIVRLKRFILQ